MEKYRSEPTSFQLLAKLELATSIQDRGDTLVPIALIQFAEPFSMLDDVRPIGYDHGVVEGELVKHRFVVSNTSRRMNCGNPTRRTQPEYVGGNLEN